MSSDSARKPQAEARIHRFHSGSDGQANPLVCLIHPLCCFCEVMSALGLCSLLSLTHLEPHEGVSLWSASFPEARARVFNERCYRKTKATYSAFLQSCCTLSPLPKGSSLKLQNAELTDVGVLSLAFERPYIMSCGKYMIQEAVLDEEYWAAAWLRAKIYCEGQSYLRYAESYQKKFAEQEFTAVKRRCLGKQCQYMKCICLVAVASEGFQNEIGLVSQLTLRDRVVGTLDVSMRQLVRRETFPKDAMTADFFNLSEPERRCGYIANVCVARSARRQGIASSLLEVAIKAAKSWKLKDLYVHVAKNNSAAQLLYTKAGFQVVEDTASKQSLRQEQLLCMCI